MNKFAVIEDGVVTNVILANSEFEIEGAMLVTLADDSVVSVGWTYQGDEFIAPIVETVSASPTPPEGALPVTEL